MIPVQFPGVDAIAGEDQGYQPLPLKRIRSFDIALEKEVPAMMTRWIFSKADVKVVNATGFAFALDAEDAKAVVEKGYLCVQITIAGQTPPPMKVEIVRTNE